MGDVSQQISLPSLLCHSLLAEINEFFFNAGMRTFNLVDLSDRGGHGKGPPGGGGGGAKCT